MDDNPNTAALGDPAIDELQRILREAEQGNKDVLPALRRVLDDNPQLWEKYGDLSRHVVSTWVKLIAGPNLVLAEALTRRAGALRAELAGPAPSALELLLVDRLVACQLSVEHADALVAQATNATPAQQTVLQRRLTGAQHRHLKAVQALATLRKLIKPGPSPLELAKRTVNETTGKTAVHRRSTVRPLGAELAN